MQREELQAWSEYGFVCIAYFCHEDIMSLPNLCHSSFSVLPSLREGSFLQEQYPTAACTVSDRVAESLVFLYIYIKINFR